MAGSQPGSVEVAHPDGAVVIHPHQDLQWEVERGQRRRHHGRRATYRVPEHQQLGATQGHPYPLRLPTVVHHEEELGAGGRIAAASRSTVSATGLELRLWTTPLVGRVPAGPASDRSEEHPSELQSRENLV